MTQQLFCPKHKKEVLLTLKYYERHTSKRDDTEIFGTQYLFCRKCKRAYRTKISISKVRDQIANVYKAMGTLKTDKMRKINEEIRQFKRQLKKDLKRRAGRPYTPKPLPIKVTRVRTGWYHSRYRSGKIHYITKSVRYCHPSQKINLDMLPVKFNPKLLPNICKTCARKKGVLSYKVTDYPPAIMNAKLYKKRYREKIKSLKR